MSPETGADVMGTERLEAFSDGVLAIIITIMILELRAPGADEYTFEALRHLHAEFLSYILSFVYIGIYWNNHHHMLRVTRRVSAGVMWANLHLLFWLSIVPFVTAWMGKTHFKPVPVSIYGVVLLLCAVAYTILQMAIVRNDGPDSPIARATGSDGKGKASIALYITAALVAFKVPAIAGAIYVLVALIWLIPDRRIERVVNPHNQVGGRDG